ncbi:TRAP-type mannitol/chloroaromatic compound transport system, large permease component [Cohaesibacter sp. ES.047]|uniref:hypothetical protein n=1 Tax=Cohaesibacter sp. ES.047 TaxID=1798205 RepID=UPI000BB779B3|nr:hypothetical protein [Cohaesibacter sp. ES.047]SNY92079.1 TRAP-type mannitol/chloroaromatic compound transport system, large permease component [Cohaesibacter sp. ES.047]
MTEWLPLLQSLWFNHAPVLLLLSFVLLYPVGYPVAFQLSALALAFGWVGVQTGLISTDRMSDLPHLLFSDLLFDSSLLCLPLLLLLTEFMVATGQMERASRAIKGYSDPAWLTIDQASRAKRKSQIRIKSAVEVDVGRRSLFMTMFTPASLLMIIVARLFELSPEAMTFVLLVPASLMCGVYLVNWLFDLWVDAHLQRLRDRAGLADSIAHKGAAVAAQGRMVRLAKLIFDVAPLFFLVALAVLLLLHWKLTLPTTFSVLACAIMLLSILQGRFSPASLAKAACRSLAATGNLAAMMLAAYCFHLVFLSLGGTDLLADSTNLLASLDPLTRAWWLLFLVLGCLVALGLFVDWILLTFILLPMLRPFFASLDFSSLLSPLWSEFAIARGDMAANSDPDLSLSALHPFQMLSLLDQYAPTRLWMAALVWLALLTSVVTYTRQSGELTTGQRGSGELGHKQPQIGLALFFILQLIGLTLVLIMPQAVFWLPAHVIG